MFLTEEDAAMLDGSIGVLARMTEQLRDLPVSEARRNLSQLSKKDQAKYRRKDMKDTQYFDVVAENALSVGNGGFGHMALFQQIFARQGVIITEECGRVPRDYRIEHDTPVIVSDPVDGSAYLDRAIGRYARPDDGAEKIGHIFDRELQEAGPSAARRHACNSSVTFLRDNHIKYTVVVNLFTGDVYVASPDGVYMGDIGKATKASEVTIPVNFFPNEGMNMLTYSRMGGKYEQNRMGTHLRFFPIDEAAYAEIGPIGPLRFANLVMYEGETAPSVHVVAHNGEKIQEMLPNIAVVLYSKGRLHAYKLFCDPPNIEHRAGFEMTPVLANSLYGNGLIANTGIKSTFLNNYDYPSQFRDTTAIFSTENDAALTMFTGMKQRQYAVRIV